MLPTYPYRRASMPEGHTIHRIAVDHSKCSRGKHVAVVVASGSLRRRRRAGRRRPAATDRGLRQASVLLLGQRAGRPRSPRPVRQVPGPPRIWTRRSADGAHADEVPRATVDLTGPTDCAIGTAEDRDRIVRRLGPDPLRDDAAPQLAYASIVRRVAPIGQLLLDQKVISGVGNVYRAEALFVNGIHPRPSWSGDRAGSVRIAVVDDRRDAAARHAPMTGSSRWTARSSTCLPAGPARRDHVRVPPGSVPALRHTDPDRRARRPALLLLPGLPAGCLTTTARSTAAHRARRASTAGASSASSAAAGLGTSGADSHQRRGNETQFGDRFGKRVAAHRSAVTLGERVRRCPGRHPIAVPTSSAGRDPTRPVRGTQIPVEQHRAVVRIG